MTDDEEIHYVPADFDSGELLAEMGYKPRPTGEQARREFHKYLDETNETLFDQLIRQEIVGLILDKYYGLSTVIFVDEQTTSVDIRDSAALALRIRDKVTEWQGYHLPDYAAEMLDMFQEGVSYAEIAHHTNDMLQRYLIEIVNARNLPKSYEIVHGADGTKEIVKDADGWMTERMIIKPLLHEAREILSALRVDPAKVHGLLNEWIGYLDSGEEFFTRDMPIDRDKVISAIKYWRNRPGVTVAKTGQV